VTLQTRPAREEDVRAIAELHVRSWQFGHQRLVPKVVVDPVSVEEREARWEERLKGGASSDDTILVADRDGEVVGSASAGPTHDRSTEAGVAEIYELFVHTEAIGTGVGGALLTGMLSKLSDGGFRAVTLWVVEANDRARRSYGGRASARMVRLRPPG
jgi:L-amino acid N-acyltransferase YncA